MYDKVDAKFGKLRMLLISGFMIEAAALLAMFDFMSSKGFGWAYDGPDIWGDHDKRSQAAAL